MIFHKSSVSAFHPMHDRVYERPYGQSTCMETHKIPTKSVVLLEVKLDMTKEKLNLKTFWDFSQDNFCQDYLL